MKKLIMLAILIALSSCSGDDTNTGGTVTPPESTVITVELDDMYNDEGYILLYFNRTQTHGDENKFVYQTGNVNDDLYIFCDVDFDIDEDLDVEYNLEDYETPYFEYPKDEEISCENITVYLHSASELIRDIN